MFLKNFNFLTDENIHPEVLLYLRNLGFNIKDVKESGLSGSTESAIPALVLKGI